MGEKRMPCKQCLRPTLIKDFPLAGKRPNTKQPHRKTVCKFCLNTTLNEEKSQNRFLTKMRKTVYNHCAKYNRVNSTEFTPRQFMRKFHWPAYQEVAKRTQVEYEAGCQYCPEPYDKYLDLNDLTLDIHNPDMEPFWSNTGFMCKTKNAQKGTQSLAAFEADNEEWQQWKEWQEQRHNIHYGMLLDKQYCLV